MTDYERISAVISFLIENFREQPDLEKLANVAGISPFYFQKMFTNWAGVSPKKFLQFISLEHAKKLLSMQHSLFETSFRTGLSGTSRLHDLFIHTEGMTPGEFKNGGKGLTISWENYSSPFGSVILASTSKGICYMAFIESGDTGLQDLFNKFPSADFQKESSYFHESGLSVFKSKTGNPEKIKLHLKGTPFQLKVWEALLRIPSGCITTYSGIAETIGSPSAARAVGSAVGENPVAYLIPCHRVIRSTGIIGEYHWGTVRKTAIIGRESAEVYAEV